MPTKTTLVSTRLGLRLGLASSESGAGGESDALRLVPASGGLASALRELQRTTPGALWIGWPGAVDHAARDGVTALLHHAGARAVYLSDDEASGFYDRYANGTLWPLLHSSIDKLPGDADADFATFRAVNERFADAVMEHARPGADDVVWVHDYQLALVPAALRARGCRARIGFFLHVPFPAEEVFRVLPSAKAIVAGMLGADLVGFQTARHRDAFFASARACGARAAGGAVDDESAVVVEHAGRRAHLAVFPIGIDFARFDETARGDEVKSTAEGLRAEGGGRKLLLGVDRLDYTKGLPRRLLAIERMLEKWPELAPQIRYVQLAIPTRETVGGYADFRDGVHRLVGRINGRFATPTGVPIHFMHRELSFEQLVGLYCAADVMVVTSLNDGMNLVAKEYVAARHDERGALVLSRFAGAAEELVGGLNVNPFDLDEVAHAMRDALVMPADEQRRRMTSMRGAVRSQTVQRWASSFLAELYALDVTSPLADDVARAAGAEGTLYVFLDYDGTLVPIVSTPAAAAPDGALGELLSALAASPATDVTVVSGRDRPTLERWLGALPLRLLAEHGAHRRERGSATWKMSPRPPWQGAVLEAARAFAASRPGALVEEKELGIAFHTRGLPEAERAAAEAEIAALFQAAAPDAHVLRGKCVVEAKGDNTKAAALAGLELRPGDVVLAAGDDVTDEALFAALPAGAVGIAVGKPRAGAKHVVRDAFELRAILAEIAGARRNVRALRRAG